MDLRIVKIAAGIVCLGLLAALFLLSRLAGRIDDLEQKQLVHQQAFKQQADLVRSALQELDTKIEDSLDEIARLQVAVFPKSERSKILPQQLDRLEKGLYKLERDVEVRGRGTSTYNKTFTIYHLKTEIGTKEVSQVIHVGMATSGVTSIPLFYLDYDGDLAVDQDMMFEFVHFIPFGRLAAKSMDPRNSQAAYDAFQESYRSAEFTPVDRITNSGSKLVSGMWKFVEDQGEGLLKWIQNENQRKKNSTQTF